MEVCGGFWAFISAESVGVLWDAGPDPSDSERGSLAAADHRAGRPKLLITPIFHDFSESFPFSPGLLAVLPGFLASRR